MLSEDLASNDLGLLGLGNICHSMGKNCISIIGSPIFGEEPDKSLR
jgi:hypothetical protein